MSWWLVTLRHRHNDHGRVTAMRIHESTVNAPPQQALWSLGRPRSAIQHIHQKQQLTSVVSQVCFLNIYFIKQIHGHNKPVIICIIMAWFSFYLIVFYSSALFSPFTCVDWPIGVVLCRLYWWRSYNNKRTWWTEWHDSQDQGDV